MYIAITKMHTIITKLELSITTLAESKSNMLWDLISTDMAAANTYTIMSSIKVSICLCFASNLNMS